MKNFSNWLTDLTNDLREKEEIDTFVDHAVADMESWELTEIEEEEKEEIETHKPEFLNDYSFSKYDIEAIQQGGCASGAFMPAVTYHEAVKFMAEHGEDVFEWFSDEGYDHILTDIKAKVHTRGTLCSYYFAAAVELWAGTIDTDKMSDNQEV